MSSNKTSISVNDIPRFHGKNYQQWASKMEGIFLITSTKPIIDGTNALTAAVEPTEPPMPANTTPAAEWPVYTAKLTAWQIKHAAWKKARSEFNDLDGKTKGLFAVALDVGIWDQCKTKSAKEIWDWLKTKYGKEAFVKVLEDFRYIRDLKIDLSDPNTQLADFMHHYQRLPMQDVYGPATDTQPAQVIGQTRIVHESMAALILLSNLPLATSYVGDVSIYQRMFEGIMKDTSVANLTLDDISDSIRSVWSARFGHLKTHEQPKRGTFYYCEPKGKGRADQRPAPQAQRNTAIKDKGPAPKHSDQQQRQSAPAASNSRGKRPFRRSNRGGQKKASARAAAPSSDFIIASSAIQIADQPSRPAPTAHTVAHISPAGLHTRREFEQGSSRLPGTAPYPTVQRARSLMSRLGVTPSTQTSKNFEEITRMEEAAEDLHEQRHIRDMSHGTPLPEQEDCEMQDVTIHDRDDDDDNESVVSWGSDNTSPILPIGSPRPESPCQSDETGGITPSTSLYHVLEGTHPSPKRVLRRLPANLQAAIGLQLLTPPPWHRTTSLRDRISSPPRSITPLRSPPPSRPNTPEDFGRHSPDEFGRFNYDHPFYNNGYEELVDHNTDWQVLHDSCAQASSLIDPLPGKLDLEDLGRSLDRVATWSQINLFFANCTNLKSIPLVLNQWIVDSGASIHFTGNESDFSDLTMFPINERPPVATANGNASVHGHGAIFLRNTVTQKGKKSTNTMRLYPVYYMPGVSVRLMSMGQILKGNMRLLGDEKSLTFIGKSTEQTLIEAFPNPLQSDTIYWVNSEIISGEELITHTSMHAEDYDLWHRRLGHPSDQVLSKVRENSTNFPSKIHIPSKSPVCSGCAKGKMPSRSFPDNINRASRPFEHIHSDLKEYPILSYHKYKWYISFVDDCTSHSWITLLRKKSDAFSASRQFIAMVKTQYNQAIKEWMSDYSGEYTSDEFELYLKEQGIKIQRSVPTCIK
jgi:hypothetical protein